MAGDRRTICFVCLYTVGIAEAPEGLDVAELLLDDPIPDLRDWAAIALLRIGTADPESQRTIRELLKSKKVNVAGPSQYGVGRPAWLDDDA